MDDDGNDCLDILGQQPALDIYTQLSLIYPVPDPSSRGDIVDTLTTGLGRLAENLPWVAGQVSRVNSRHGGLSSYRIVPLGGTPSLTIRDLQQDESAPTMSSLRRARFPFRMLDEAVIAPQKTLPGAGPRPVFAMQANFITGGLILTFVSQHQAMDLTGQCRVMSLLSKVCRDARLTDVEVAGANPTRCGRIPPLDESILRGSDLDLQAAKSPASRGASYGALAPASWAYFAFSTESLVTIKRLAMENVSTPPGFVSTDDALTAFLWQSVGRVRGQRIGLDAKSTLGRAVDVRRHLGIPETYPGLMQNLAFQTHSVQELAAMPLGGVASELRFAVEPNTSSLAYATRALAARIRGAEDKSTVYLAAGIAPSVDFLLSSWTNPSFYDMDFGLGLGTPEVVRRPRFVPVEGLSYLMPRRASEEIVVAICLRDEDLLRLRSDGEFAKFGTYIG